MDNPCAASFDALYLDVATLLDLGIQANPQTAEYLAWFKMNSNGIYENGEYKFNPVTQKLVTPNGLMELKDGAFCFIPPITVVETPKVDLQVADAAVDKPPNVENILIADAQMDDLEKAFEKNDLATITTRLGMVPITKLFPKHRMLTYDLYIEEDLDVATFGTYCCCE